MQLDKLIDTILEKGADPASFSESVKAVADLSLPNALLVWLKILSKNPDLILARLELAKTYWQLDCVPFALEQLQRIEATEGSSSEALRKLIERMGGTLSSPSTSSAQSPAKAQTLASLDFDIEVVEQDK